MKPESRIEGRKKKNDICIAWSWFFAMVENVMPIGEIRGDEDERDDEEERDAADASARERGSARRAG